MDGHLLDDLYKGLQLHYLSDLKNPNVNVKLHSMLTEVNLSSYPETEWIAAAAYLTKVDEWKSAVQAKEGLLEFLCRKDKE